MSTTLIDPTQQEGAFGASASTIPTPSTTTELPDPSTYRVYRPPNVSGPTPSKRQCEVPGHVCDSTNRSEEITDIPATYFEVTMADIKAVQNSLHARTEALVNVPFRTREMKEAAEKAKADKYPTVSIRSPAR